MEREINHRNEEDEGVELDREIKYTGHWGYALGVQMR